MNFDFKKTAAFSLTQALSLEWLETNGLGGYASSTIVNAHTRKYHGLLVCPIDDHSKRHVLLSKTEDSVVIDSSEHLLSASQYPGYFQDGSFEHYQSFTLDPHPKFTYKFKKGTLTKEIILLYKENTVLIKYTLQNISDVVIKIRPLFALRNFHSLTKQDNSWNPQNSPLQNGEKICFIKNIPPLFMQTNLDCDFKPESIWYNNFEYLEEKNRGYDFTEDLFSPCLLEASLTDKEPLISSCSLNKQDSALEDKWKTELKRRLKQIKKLTGTPLQKQLKTAATSFIKKGLADKSYSVIAGYHWFEEWGRDTMIALPGLTLYNGLENHCVAVLKKFRRNERKGLIPNFLGTSPKDNAYNSVDASLWFAWAVQQYYLKTKNLDIVKKKFWDSLKKIFTSYKKGTLFETNVNDFGLIYAGNRSVNLTWMDAIVNEVPATPRYGMAVEINALWFNMLCFMEELAEHFNDPIKKDLSHFIQLVKDYFQLIFWNEEKGYLNDFVNNKEHNAAIRPNQIFAVSLPFSPITKSMARNVVKTVKDHLLTPYGLRTLSKHDSNYIGHYEGTQEHRDMAYHNGTVWPWLLGHFGEASLKVSKNRQATVKMLNSCLRTISEHLLEYGLGTVAEIFSGDKPHQPNGCISQAWSIAEILRLSYLINNNDT